MRSACWVLGALFFGLGLAQAQPLPDREALAKTPLDAAMILDPTGPWQCRHLIGVPGFTLVTGLDQEGGFPRFTVAEAGKFPEWCRDLAVPVDALRYPVVVATYRASGIQPDDRSVLYLGRTKRAPLAILGNRELVGDGQIHEVVVDLRDEVQDTDAEFTSLLVSPRCQGPEPAVFELLGLCFESDQQLPPLEKTEEAELSVQALDANGQPIAGATVTADPDWLNLARTTTTDAEGKATLAVADTCRAAHSLRLTKPGMAIAEIVTDEEGHLSPTVVMYPGARYGGVVRNEAGEPIPNVAVSVYVHLPGRGSRGEWWSSAVLTDADGRWATPVLPATRRPSIHLEHPDYAAQDAKDLPPNELREQRSEVVLGRGGRLTVRVVGPDGSPVPEAQLRLSRNWNRVGEPMKTGPEGTAAFPDRLLGPHDLLVQAQGFALQQTSVDVKPDLPPVEIRLEPGGVIRGRIVDTAGNPVPEVRLIIEHWRNYYSGILWESATDAEGRFAWREAPSGVIHFHLGKPGYMTLMSYPLYAHEEEQTIVLPAPLVVRGRITDAETGQPIATATVVPGLVTDGNPLAERPPNWMDEKRGKAEDGNYQVSLTYCSGLDSAVLKAEADGYSSMTSRTIRFDEEGVVCDFPLRKGKEFAGTVRLPSGQPAAGARVFLLHPGQRIMIANALEVDPGTVPSATTGPDGRYRLSELERGGIIVALHPEGYLEISATSWEDAPSLPLQAWGRVEGQFRLGPDPVANATVRYEPNDASWPPDFSPVRHSLQATTNEQGQFVLPRVPPGQGRITGTRRPPDPGGTAATHSEPFELPPGSTLTVDLIGGGRPVVGRIVPPQRDGLPIAWKSGRCSLNTRAKLDIEEPAHPDFGKDLTSTEARKRIDKWGESTEGKAYVAAMMRYYKARAEALAAIPQNGFFLSLAADGAFRFDGVPAGDYDLRVFLYAEDSPGFSVSPVGQAQLTIAVPADHNEEPLDLDPIQVEAVKR